MKRGWELFWEQNGPRPAASPSRRSSRTTPAIPASRSTKAQRLVEEEGVQFVAGPILANTAYAVADYVAEAGIPTFQITGADDLTQRQFDPLVLRAGYTSSQSNFPAGQWAYDQGHRNAVTICPDYPFGWESCGGFVKAFTDAGGTVTQVWHPLGTQDFSSYVTEIQAASPDVVFIGSAGGPDAILFWQAWTGFGLKDTIPLIGNCCFADQVLLRDQGEAASGITSFSYWTEGRDSEAVRAFVEAYEAKHGEVPSLYAAGSYLMAQLFATDPRADRRRHRRRRVHRRDQRHRPRRQRLRADLVRRVQQHRRRRESRAHRGPRRRGLLERRRRDDPGREPVLDVRRGRVPRQPGLQPGLTRARPAPLRRPRPARGTAASAGSAAAASAEPAG